jgi:hypothetical protein
MKNYFNAAEKQIFILASAAGTAIGTVLDNSGTRFPKQVAADLKRARTYLIKALQNWVEPVDERSREAMKRQAAGVNIGVISDISKRLEQERYVKYIRDVREKAYADGGRDYVYDLAEHTLAMVCGRCDGKPKHQGCPLYEAYRHFEIEFWNAHHPECEYSGTGELK